MRGSVKEKVITHTGCDCYYCGKEGMLDGNNRPVEKEPTKIYTNIYDGTYIWGHRSMEWEHKIPLSRGGHNNRKNIVLACRKCNREKGSLTDEEYRARKNAE